MTTTHTPEALALTPTTGKNLEFDFGFGLEAAVQYANGAIVAPGLYVCIGCRLKLASEWDQVTEDDLLGLNEQGFRFPASRALAAVRALLAFARAILPDPAEGGGQ